MRLCIGHLLCFSKREIESGKTIATNLIASAAFPWEIVAERTEAEAIR